MNPEVRRRWISWSAQFEGRVKVIYADIKGLPTTGVGNLLPDVASALLLPWKRIADNSLATRDQIVAEWNRVNGNAQLAHDGYRAAERQATIYLSESAIDALVLSKLDSNDAVLAKQFAGWDGLPWQVVMAIHSIAWACGPRFGFPKFRAAVARRDWLEAAKESAIPGEQANRGLIPRNSANKQLLMEAANAAPSPPRVPTAVLPAAAGSAPLVTARAAPTILPTPGKWRRTIEGLIGGLLALFGKRKGPPI